MKVVKFEDLIAWQKARDLTVEIYSAFEQTRDFAFRNQIQSAAVSVSNNIAEGFDSKSKREFMRFLGIARNFCNEVKSMCYLAERLKHIEVSKKNHLLFFCEEVTRIIVGLSKSIIPKMEAK
ncbi:four helix bundle protein [Agriterribacter sp.]|uniref:four helix bundle protein n=1 Tax=Agriterribacter sp. TaxID=2821509 RepID=UPI002BF6BFCC|nr:four helix bundle protein [Agriterribacter sp.]HRO45406.1 four helix bundle protein [Agriterribacter sp.]